MHIWVRTLHLTMLLFYGSTLSRHPHALVHPQPQTWPLMHVCLCYATLIPVNTHAS